MAGGLLLVAALSVQGLLWIGGTRGINTLDLLLPHRWDHVHDARADAFRRLAMEALQEGRHQEMMLALATAEDTAPGTNLETGLISLRLAEHRQNYVSTDKLHQHLVRHYPDHRPVIEMTYHDALLVSGRWPTLARSCLRNLASPSPDSTAWLRSLALAASRLPDLAAFRTTNAETIAAIPPTWRPLVDFLLYPDAPPVDFSGEHLVALASIAVEHAARTGDTTLAADALGALATQPDVFRDLRLNNRYRLRFPQSSRDPSALRATLTDLAETTEALQALISDALRSNDAGWLASISNRLPTHVPPECAGDLWLAASVLGADDFRQDAENRLLAANQVPASYFQLAAQREPGATGWSEWIAIIPCSREMLFALAELRPSAPSSAR